MKELKINEISKSRINKQYFLLLEALRTILIYVILEVLAYTII